MFCRLLCHPRWTCELLVSSDRHPTLPVQGDQFEAQALRQRRQLHLLPLDKDKRCRQIELSSWADFLKKSLRHCDIGTPKELRSKSGDESHKAICVGNPAAISVHRGELSAHVEPVVFVCTLHHVTATSYARLGRHWPHQKHLHWGRRVIRFSVLENLELEVCSLFHESSILEQIGSASAYWFFWWADLARIFLEPFDNVTGYNVERTSQIYLLVWMGVTRRGWKTRHEVPARTK